MYGTTFGRLPAALLAIALISITCLPVWAIPPDTPVTNVATVSYVVAGETYNAVDSATVRTDANAGNSAPFAIALDPPSVPENAVAAVVGSLQVADPDPDDSHVIVVNDPRFTVVGTTLQLAPDVSLDFETTPLVVIEITVTDPAGASYTQLVEVAVEDVNEAPEQILLSSN